MSTSRHFEKICIVVVAGMLLITGLFLYGNSQGMITQKGIRGYESHLFDQSRVHSVDIVMDDWDAFIEKCEDEEYETCTVIIDGEKYGNVAIRAKGNTSLSTVKQLGSKRYSFKLEFDHYDNTKSYYGLDKLCLNNLIQDHTMMKDYVVYTMMDEFGVDAPLCSYVNITVNGKDWGLYLAVEGVEDAFLARNYGSENGDLYKPDSIGFGGGRGNGKGFNMDDLNDSDSAENNGNENSMPDTDPSKKEDTTSGATGAPDGEKTEMPENGMGTGGMNGARPEMPQGNPWQKEDGKSGATQPSMPDMNPFENQDSTSGVTTAPSKPDGHMPSMPQMNPWQKEDGTSGATSDQKENRNDNGRDLSDNNIQPVMMFLDETSGATTGDQKNENGPQNNRGGMGMGSDDVKLRYIDDDPDSYQNIFDNAKTDVSDEDQKRLIASLKKLSTYSDIEEIVDVDEVMRYFVVHNFVCNGDSYTGSMIHNYYLYEEDGKMSMIPWDYNLAFGTFQGNNASSTVNTSIDQPVSGDVNDRPMVGWIFSSDTYQEQYHQYFKEFINMYATDGKLTKLISDTKEMIASYVEKDPTKFCTYEEFEKGVEAITSFTSLRLEAVLRQLNGDTTKVDTGTLNLSDMGTMGGGMRKDGNIGQPSFSVFSIKDENGNEVELTTLIKDLSEIATLNFKDGTSVTLNSNDMRSLMKRDLTELISVTTKSGEVIDLSKYTITMNTPQGSGDRNNNDKRSDMGPAENGMPPTMPEMNGKTDGNIPSVPDNNQKTGSDLYTWIYAGASLVILLIGLITVKLFGRR